MKSSIGSLVQLVCFFLIVSVLNGSLLTSGRDISEVPNPMKDPLACGRVGVARSAVCDPDKKMTKDQKDEIEGYINAITNGQVAVAVIEKMNMVSLYTFDIDVAAEKFARSLHDSWGVGNAEKNDGILIFLSIKDRAVFISTGSGVQKLVTSAYIQDIISDMKPFLRKADYGGAISTALIDLDLYLSGDSGQIKAKYSNKARISATDGGEGSDKYSTIVGFLFFFGISGVMIYMQRRRDLQMRGYERGRAALDNLMRDVDNTEENNKFFTSSCPICLEDFPTTPSAGTTNKSTTSQESTTTTTTTTEVETENDSLLPSGGVNTSSFTSTTTTTSTSVTPSAVPFQCVTNSHTHNNNDKMKPMALRCGHTFCAPCLESFLRTAEGNKCPICRANVEGGDMPPNTPSGPANGANGQGSSVPQPVRRQTSPANGTTPATAQDPIPPRDPIVRDPRPTVDRASGDGISYTDHTTSPFNSGGSARGSCADQFREQSAAQDRESASQQDRQESTNSFARRAPEIRFRMNRMHHLYPDVMTIEMLRLMNGAVDRGNIHDFRANITRRGAEVQRIVTDIRASAAAAARRSGSSGSSSSGFGGGRSSGGGGGRW